MTMELFLQETQAAVLIFDLRGFSTLAAATSPLELGATLGHYYAHAEGIVRAHEGRIVRFSGDVVLATWLATEVPDHLLRAASAMSAARAAHAAWLGQRWKPGLPAVDYSLTAAEGMVLAGQIGTARHRSFDVLGEPVSVASRLAAIANARGVDQLMTFRVPEIAAVEVESIEIGGKPTRLFRLS